MSKTNEVIDKLVAAFLEEYGAELLQLLLKIDGAPPEVIEKAKNVNWQEPVVESKKVTIMADSAKEMHKNEH